MTSLLPRLPLNVWKNWFVYLTTPRKKHNAKTVEPFEIAKK